MKSVGIIGCGYWGAKHARVLNELEGVSLHSVADLDIEKVAELTGKYEGVTGLTDFNQMLLDPKIDAVVIATPASSHFKLALKALKARKHVFVEKPLSLVPEEAQRLIELSEKEGLTLMVGHTFEYHPSVQVLREVVQSGQLGELYYLDTARLNLGLYQRDVNVIHDLSPHDISMMIYILGQRPVEVTTRGYSLVHGGVVDVAYIEYRFEQGLVANSRVSWLAPRKERQITIVGSRKMVMYDDVAEHDPVKLFEKRIEAPQETEQFQDWKFAYHYGDVTAIPVPGGEPLKIEISHFIECVEKGIKPKTDGINGRTVVSVLHAAQLSLKNGGRPQFIEYYDQSASGSRASHRQLEVGAAARKAAFTPSF